MAGAVDTLFLPHKSGVFPMPDAPWIFLGAQTPNDGFAHEFRQHLICEQNWRDSFLMLQSSGINVSTNLGDVRSSYAGAFVLLTKHKRENQAMIARANNLTASGKPVLVAGDKNLGIASIRKWVGHSISVIDAMAKHHANVFWFEANPKIEFSVEAGSSKLDGFAAEPGMFSAEKIDKGSALLAEFIDERVKGDVADFGAGWGYLSAQILKSAKPKALDLYEAHHPSLEAAKRNVSQNAHETNLRFYWHDLASEPIKVRYDWIIMNPPFHTGRKSEPSLGERFIEVAAGSLKKGGQLLMVANTNLPYEGVLKQHFAKQQRLAVRDGFKVFVAAK